jgi:hypothetical protein
LDTIEKRSHKRIKPAGIKADVHLNSNVKPDKVINGEILDISFSGIRIKLSKPLPKNTRGTIKISLKLPVSGSPFQIYGTLKHQQSDSECSIHYTDHVMGSIDDLVYECIKLTDQTVFIKTI